MNLSPALVKNTTMKPSFIARLRSFLSSENDGGALVEMAVTLPMVLGLMTGIFSFSIALYQKLQLSEAVSNAGHLLVTDRGDTNPCSTATAAIYAAAPGLKQSNITLTYTLNGVSTGTSCPGTGTGGVNTNMVAGDPAEIQATYTCSLGVYGMKNLTCNLASSVTEVVQ
jgi:Flp pilus assembly protein TadG